MSGVARRERLVLIALLLFGARVIGCSASEDPGGTVGPGVGGSIGKGGSMNLGGSANHSGSGGGGGINLGGGNPGDGALTPDAACAGETHQGEKIPLSMYILLDTSSSMVDFGSPKWSQVVTAINTFASTQQLSATKIALQIWAGEGPCDGSVYDTPAIAMSPIPQSAPQISSWLSGITPYGNTPTQGALNGLAKYTKQYATANPGEKTVGLLVTDGLPTTCDVNPATLIGIASAAFNGTPSILVYTMGMQGADFGLLNALAQAGGTGQAFDATSGTQAFIDALQTISGTALACEFTIPTPNSGTLDPNKVNLEYTPSSGPPAQQLYKVDNAAACVQWGWYYDDNTNPKKVILCDQTCDQVKLDPQGTIDLILGCKAIPPA